MSTRDNRKPNILITGPCACGKSFLCQMLAPHMDFNFIDCSILAREQELYEFDEKLKCSSIDEGQLIEYMEPLMKPGGNVVEYHDLSVFPKKWFDAVFVLACPDNILGSRLSERGSNVQLPLNKKSFEEIYDSARTIFNPDIVYEVKAAQESDTDKAITLIQEWYSRWKKHVAVEV